MLKRKYLTVVILIVFMLLISGCSDNSTATDGQLKVHFLDVGHADSILVQMPQGQNMLVDAGNNNDGDYVVNYLKKTGIKQIDYLIGTHPHEDHIGGLDTVIENFSIGKVYMPGVNHSTKTFEDVLEAVQAKGLKITTAKAGVQLINNADLTAVLLAPQSSTYDSLNNYSAVIKITYGQVSFLFAGDAEEQSEFEMLASSNINCQADVLKVGHHGSNSSTSAEFLKAVEPKFAVISVGNGNNYGHPHKEILERLNGVELYRTDINGNIVFTTDGKDINAATEKSSPARSPSASGVANDNAHLSGQVYVDDYGQGLIKGNINSKGERIYHLPGESSYDQTKPEAWFKTEEEARTAGFRPPKM